jgi:two-component system OmpR family sensor kinase
MDGFRRRLSQSVQLQLSYSLAAAVVAMAVLAGVFAFATAFQEANDLQDDTLREIAALLGKTPLPSTHSIEIARAVDVDEDVRVIVQPVGSPGAPIEPRAGDLPFPATLRDGLQTLEVDGIPLRMVVTTHPDGRRFVVAQKAQVLDEIAREAALRTVAPFLLLVPVLLLVVARLVRRMFRPIAILSAEIDLRDVRDLRPVQETGLPLEVRPFATAINRMLGRVHQSMELQRRFIADAAHEIRTPMTAMSLQAERLSQADMSLQARERLTTLRSGIERGRNLLEKLLTLARSQDGRQRVAAPIAVRDVYRQVLEDLVALAEAKRIDVGVEGDQDVRLHADEADLVAMVKNLVENAIRYSPEGGRVDISAAVTGDVATLQVRDSGPGIPLGERERVFDPFYRALGHDTAGSGLGLAIVKAVADRIGANINLAYCDEKTQTGLCASVIIPVSQGI